MHYPKLLLLVISILLTHTAKAQMMPDMVSYYGGDKTIVTNIVIDTQRKCMYIAGITADSFGIATAGTHKENIGPLFYIVDLPILFFWNTDIFIAKFDMAGNRLWGTYYGGVGKEQSPVIQLNSEGDLFLTGFTNSEEGISTIGSYQPNKYIDSVQMPFLAKISKTGTLLWGTYYTNDSIIDHSNIGNTITVDNDDNVYITGGAIENAIIATEGAFQPIAGGSADAFIAKFDTDGELVWATYFGGEKGEYIIDMQYTPDGYLYIVGNTNSYTNIATAGTHQSTNLSPTNPYNTSGFVNKFTVEGERVWGSYISSSDSSGPDSINTKITFANGIAIDQNSNLYITGMTNAVTNISSAETYRQDLQGFKDHFLMKFDPNGQKIWGTYLGTDGNDNLGSSDFGVASNQHFAVTPDGNQLYFAGSLEYAGFLESSCSLEDADKSYIIRLNGSGNMESINKYNSPIFNLVLDPSNGNNPQQEIYFAGRTDVDGLATEDAFKDNMTGQLYAGIFGRLLETCPDAVPATISYADGTLSIGADYISYNWYHNGVLISDASDHTFSIGADSTGYYYATFQTCACSYYSDTFFFDPLSIQHPSLANNTIDIYPNPSTGHVKVALKNTNTSIQSIQVSDLIGSVLFTVKMLPPATHQYELDISTYPSGIYLVTIMTAHGTHTTKLVKQ